MSQFFNNLLERGEGSLLDLFARETHEIIHISTKFTEETGGMRSFP